MVNEVQEIVQSSSLSVHVSFLQTNVSFVHRLFSKGSLIWRSQESGQEIRGRSPFMKKETRFPNCTFLSGKITEYDTR